MQFYQQIGEALQRQPGVKTVSWASIIPLSNVQWDENFYGPDGKEQDFYENSVGPDYFKAMTIPMFDGRDFRWDDRAAGGSKVILNRAAAELLFPGQNPIGQIIDQRNDGKVKQFEVIGVVGNAKYQSMRAAAPPTIYHPMTQNDGDQSLSYEAVVRIDGSASSLPAAARAVVRQLNPEIPAPLMSSMSSTVDDSLSAERTMALLSVFFAACALIVTAIGLYGTLAYATARRTSEIGIRMALGAKRANVAGMVFLQNSAVALAGSAAGLACALVASRAINSFLYNTSARDPWIYAASLAILASIASAASLIPAWRAARIDPMRAIRCE
jgi:predicted permease